MRFRPSIHSSIINTEINTGSCIFSRALISPKLEHSLSLPVPVDDLFQYEVRRMVPRITTLAQFDAPNSHRRIISIAKPIKQWHREGNR